MSDLIRESGNRLFAGYVQHCLKAEPVVVNSGAMAFDKALWRDVEEAGYPLALLAEAAGGFGFDADDALLLPALAAEQVVSLPLGETMLANWLLGLAGLEPAAGPAVIVGPLDLTGGNILRGMVGRVAWGRDIETLVLLVKDGDDLRIARLNSGWQVAQPAHNLAGEARDDLRIDTVVDSLATQPLRADLAQSLTAVVRCIQIAAISDQVLTLCVEYANDRVQFGRPLGKFQVIQHYLATMASEVAASRAASAMVVDAFVALPARQDSFMIQLAAAKLRCSEAAGKIAGTAHQIHGAIGFTHEYALQRMTRRLWAWRDEGGNDALWADRLGEQVLAVGADDFWGLLTDTRAN